MKIKKTNKYGFWPTVWSAEYPHTATSVGGWKSIPSRCFSTDMRDPATITADATSNEGRYDDVIDVTPASSQRNETREWNWASPLRPTAEQKLSMKTLEPKIHSIQFDQRNTSIENQHVPGSWRWKLETERIKNLTLHSKNLLNKKSWAEMLCQINYQCSVMSHYRFSIVSIIACLYPIRQLRFWCLSGSDIDWNL